MEYRFRHAVCNELFEGWKFADTCRAVRQAGYSGLEIAPFTLAEDPGAIPDGQRREYRSIMESEGLSFVGLHWLMVSPKGLHVTTPDHELRERSWLHIRRLIDLCADLGGGIMVFGSPKQRSSTGGLSPAEATSYFVEGLAEVAPQAEARRVMILIEALPRAESDIVQTIDEAAFLAEQIDSPAIETMFDTHNGIDEMEPHAVLVERHIDRIRHLHVNEMDGRHPGTGSYDYRPVLDVLRRRNYGGWVSLEAFDFRAGAETIARESLRFLESQTAQLVA